MFTINFITRRSFLFSFIIVFFGVFLTKTGIRVPNFISPLSQTLEKQKDSFKDVREKLHVKPNNFFLNQKYSLISNSQLLANNASSYLVIDFDSGEILSEKKSSEPLPIASLTKIMTAVVALDLADPKELFRITRDAQNQIPTKIGVVAGQKMTLEELLNATLLTSANDAAYAIKNGINEKYNDKIFIRSMNEKAKFLGLKNTNFSNPQGFDSPNNYSSAKDLSVLTKYALNNYPLIKDVVKKDYEFLPENKNHKKYDLYNWNGLVGVYPNTFGVKIGNTEAADTTTIVTSEREEKKILAVVLGAPGVLERDLWAADLLDFGFEKILNLPRVAISELDLQAKYNTWQYWN